MFFWFYFWLALWVGTSVLLFLLWRREEKKVQDLVPSFTPGLKTLTIPARKIWKIVKTRITDFNWERRVHKILVTSKILTLKVEQFLNAKIYAIRERIKRKEEAERYWQRLQNYIHKKDRPG